MSGKNERARCDGCKRYVSDVGDVVHFSPNPMYDTFSLCKFCIRCVGFEHAKEVEVKLARILESWARYRSDDLSLAEFEDTVAGVAETGT